MGGVGAYREAVPFEGEAPDVSKGDAVLCRDMGGQWHPKVAVDGPRYDHVNATKRTYLTVPVVTREAWEAEGERAWWINPREFGSWEAVQAQMNDLKERVRDALQLPDSVRIVVLAGADLEVAESGNPRGG
jgi:hypothetical protein